MRRPPLVILADHGAGRRRADGVRRPRSRQRRAADGPLGDDLADRGHPPRDHHPGRRRAIPEPTPCGAFAGGGVGPDTDILFIAQQPDAALAYPAGAGLPIVAHQAIHLEIELLFTGAFGLALPAGEQVTVTGAYDLPDGVELTCDFDNQSGADVGFGLGANDEMCFLWAHYVAAAEAP